MAEAKTGDTVRVHYTGKLADGTVFDTSKERHPLKFTLGNGQVIAGFEQAIIGMNPGDSKTIRIPPDQAYGEHRKELVITFNRSQLPQGMNPQVGQRLELTQENDQTVLTTIVGVNDTDLLLDANHPLAGKELTFDLQLGAIE
jgi:FKBP-type peptidyl-prolyl cis-trans isomerase 2